MSTAGGVFVNPNQVRAGKHLGSGFVSPNLGQMKYETVMPWGKTAIMDQWVESPNAAWGDEAYEAPAAEDISVMGPQGGDDTLGLGQTTVPAPVDASAAPAPAAATPPVDDGMSTAAKLGYAVFVGGLIVLAANVFLAPAEVGKPRRSN